MNERDFKKHLEELAEGKPESQHTHGSTSVQPVQAELRKPKKAETSHAKRTRKKK